jgi:putative ABC transport system ATP-binding protein
MSIVVKNLNKVYRLGSTEIHAVRGLSLTVKGGEMIALIGPSGSGKTTLLNIIGGLDRASSGSVTVFGEEVTAHDPAELVEFRRRTVGHIFQTLNLIPTLTAAENVELPMVALGIPKAEQRKRVEELIDVIGLRDRMGHKPGELSGGEQQRVAIAAALANDPPLILADEPTGELDTMNAGIVVDYLSKVNREMGKTIIMVTHDPTAARVSDRILRIQDGIIKTDVEPVGAEASGPATYTETLRGRVAEIDVQLSTLNKGFKQGKMTGDEYVERQTRLKQTRSVLIEELHRLGVVH